MPPSLRFLLPRLALAGLAVVAITGCRKPTVKVYLAPRDSVAAAQSGAPAAEPMPELAWTLPQGWKETGPGQMSLASFAIEDASGTVRITVSSPLWKIWTFPFMKGSKPVAVVAKKWSGLLNESFTDKDRFRVEYQDPKMTVNERLLVLAAAVFIVSRTALYGRYWGAVGDFHSLHFETCYHQGIEYCIEHGIARFEPGTQGEHKIVRGFEPSPTHSAHYIADRRFREAIADYLQRERAAVQDYSDAAASHVPFHRG